MQKLILKIKIVLQERLKCETTCVKTEIKALYSILNNNTVQNYTINTGSWGNSTALRTAKNIGLDKRVGK